MTVELCVCAEPLLYRGLYPCGHALCPSCTLKKRVLMKDMNCPYCRSPAAEVAVLERQSASFEDAKFEFKRGHIRVENEAVRMKLHHILQFPCPECDIEQRDLKTLKKHVENAHKKAICDVCTKNELNFSDDFILYQPGKIKDHLKKKHAFCKYCRSYFYGTSEFAAHCKKVHVACDICERRDPEHPQYFESYNPLRKHYQQQHYLCDWPECLANMHIVFGTALELQKHMMEAHYVSANDALHHASLSREVDHLTVSDTNADNANERSSKDDVDSHITRYQARLDIVAGHDLQKVAKIQGANETFKQNKVPADIFIATYEAVLSGQSPQQITLLLMAFTKTYNSVITPENSRALNLKLYQRDQEHNLQATKEKAAQEEQSRRSHFSDSKNKNGGMAPVPIQQVNWGLKMPRSGGITGISNLPSLGSRNSASLNLNRTSGKSVTASVIDRPTLKLGDLPTLNKRMPAPSDSRQSTSPQKSALSDLRQTTIPLRSPSSSSSSYSSLSSLPRLDSRSSTRVTTSPQPFLASSSTTSTIPRVNAVASAQKNKPSLALNNLPTLPKTKKEDDKKRQRNIIRIV